MPVAAQLLCAVIFTASGRILIAENGSLTSADVVAALRAQLVACQTVEAKYRMYRPGLSSPGLEIDDSGRGLFAEWDYGSEEATGRKFIYGRQAIDMRTLGLGKFVYKEECYAFDGKVLRSKDIDRKAGMISSPQGVFDTWRGPMQLLGKLVAFQPTVRDLTDLLDGSEIVAEGSEPGHGIYHLVTPIFIDGPTGEGIDAIPYAFRAHIWVDSNRGFAPSKFEVRNAFSDALMREYVTDELREVSPEIWFPIRGKVTFYTIKTVTYPEQSTAANVPAFMAALKKNPKPLTSLTPDEVKALRKAMEGIQYVTQPLGDGGDFFVVEPTSVKVNHVIADERFTFEFPDGYRIWNEFEKKGEIIGEPASELETLQPSGGFPWFLATNIAVIVLLAFLVILRRYAFH